jgi:uncharacterized protein DUF6636
VRIVHRLLLLLPLALLLTAAPARAADPQMWQSPSGNIACATYGSQLRCDMRRLGVAPPARPSRCFGDWGHAFTVTRTASKGRRLCITDALGGPGTPTVAYGRTWRRGGFSCAVRRDDVRCTNARGHGFALRIGRQRLF